MALGWLRKRQKQFLAPLSVVIIVSFVFMWGAGGRRRGGPGEGIIAEVGGRKITRAEYGEYRRILRALGYRPAYRAAYFLLVKAEAARRAGMRVGTEQLRDQIRMVVRGALRPGGGELTESEYREALAELNITPSAFEEFIETKLLADVAPLVVASASLVTEDEHYLAYCRERERLTLRQRDFMLKSFEKEVEKPTDEEVREYYDGHADLDPERETALSTEPEVAIEYGFAEKKLAGRLARGLRDRSPLAGLEGLAAGGPGAAAGGLARAAVAQVREKEILDRYERDKDRRYKLPDEPEPKEEGKEGKEGTEGEEAGEGEEGVEGEEGGEPKDPKDPPKPRYRPLAEVRDEIAKGVDSPLEDAAARQAAERVLEVAEERSRLRTFEADALTAGLGLAALPGALASSGIWDRADFMSACEEAGAVYGATGLLDEKGLKAFAPLGSAWGISNRAIEDARAGEGGRLKEAARVANGYAVWRVADHLAPRTLTFDEAKSEVAARIVHARVEKKARDAATDFISELVEGTADLSTMRERRPVPAMRPEVKPFAGLGAGEIPEQPAAFEKTGNTVVDEELRQADEELAVMRTARYRVAIIVDRDTPTREKFRKDEAWRTRQARMLRLVRRTFMVEHWQDESPGKVKKKQFYRQIDARR